MERFIKMAIMQETEDEKFNVSINIIGTESPEPAVLKIRRPVHSRSNSDVTPRCVCPLSPAPPPPPPPPPSARHHPRSRSLGARPSNKSLRHHQALSLQKTSPSHLAVDFSPHLEISTLSSILAKCEKTTSPVCSPRKIRSEQTSPSVSVMSISDSNPSYLPPASAPIDNTSSQLVYVPSDPWTKQSESDVKNSKKLSRTNHLSLECSPADNGPWILNSSYSQSQRQLYRKVKSFSKQKSTIDNRKMSNISSSLQVSNLASRRNSKLERLSPVSCNVCWSTDTCKCSRIDDNLSFNIPLSPASLDRSPDFILRSSPIRLTAEKQVIIKKSPVVVKKNTQSLSVKCPHELEVSPLNGKVNMMCTCTQKQLSWVSPRPSPRKSVHRSEYLSVSKDNEIDLLEARSRKSSFSKAASASNTSPSVLDSPSLKIINCDVADTGPAPAPSEAIGIKSVDTCDPLLETTC